MPAQLRCEASVAIENDHTGENAVTCGALALACAECGGLAGCHEHAMFCAHCAQPLCEGCLTEASREEKKTRAA